MEIKEHSVPGSMVHSTCKPHLMLCSYYLIIKFIYGFAGSEHFYGLDSS